MTVNNPFQGHQNSDRAHIPTDTAEALSSTASEPSFGGRLRAAREARRLELSHCAQLLKLPARVLRQLEDDSYSDIDSKVYLASYIGKYARYIGINEASIQVELNRIKNVEPTLVATGGISHSRFLLDQYATAATYVVLTAVIVVPMLWLGIRGTLNHDLARMPSLDASPVARHGGPASSSSAVGAEMASTSIPGDAVVQAPEQEQTLMASMAPFPNLDASTLAPPKLAVAPLAKVDATSSVGAGAHSLSLKLSAASWVEVTDADGKRLEYGLLPAGSSHEYRSDEALNVRIGNASGALIALDGKPIVVDNFRHANVAHFRVKIQDGKATPVAM